MRIERKNSEQIEINSLQYGDVFCFKGKYFIVSDWCFKENGSFILLGVNLQDGTCEKFRTEELVELVACHLVLD